MSDIPKYYTNMPIEVRNLKKDIQLLKNILKLKHKNCISKQRVCEVIDEVIINGNWLGCAGTTKRVIVFRLKERLRLLK